MHIQPSEVLIRPAVQQVKQRTPGRDRDFGGVGLHLAAIAGVSVGDVVEVELLQKALQLVLRHASKVFA